MNVTEFGSAASSRLWIINPKQKEIRERPQSPRNTTEAQFRKCINRIEFKLVGTFGHLENFSSIFLVLNSEL